MIGRYPEDRLFEEVAFVAYHFHWSREEVLNMPHHERTRWCEEISEINERINEESGVGDGVRTTKKPGGGMTLEQDLGEEFFED